jgi:hypothetical protein
MMATSILHVASSLLLLPYGLLCVCGIKEKLQPDVYETELGGEEQGKFVAWFDRFLVVFARGFCSRILLGGSARRVYSTFTPFLEV